MKPGKTRHVIYVPLGNKSNIIRLQMYAAIGRKHNNKLLRFRCNEHSDFILLQNALPRCHVSTANTFTAITLRYSILFFWFLVTVQQVYVYVCVRWRRQTTRAFPLLSPITRLARNGNTRRRKL